MTISSSNRVIKQGDHKNAAAVKQFVPPETRFLKAEAVEQPEGKGTEKPEKERNAAKEKVRRSSRNHYIDPEEAELRAATSMIETARKESQQLLVKAGSRVEKILAEAEEEARMIREEAQAKGFEEGLAMGREEGKKEVRQEYLRQIADHLNVFQQDIESGLKALETAKQSCLRNYLDELKSVALAVAEKVIHVSLETSGEVMKRMIIAATEKLKKTAWVKIYIDKYDYEMMIEADTDIIDELSRLSDNVKFIVMDKEDRGNCIIEMPEEIIDVSVNTQLENIKDILENVHL
ncbi:FliH/SctL family protein [Hungatella hathewayi]|uniref:FliH/SctL family protein n=1 Tax=Hungatella hathewayi TaxID=154046 RepID=UPI003562A0BF